LKHITEGAHIYPFSLSFSSFDIEKDGRAKYFWKVLGMFWNPERVNNWKAEVFDGSESCKNLMCLSPDAHRYWGNCNFALKPLEDETEDPAKLRVQFFWMPRNQFSKIQSLRERPSLPSNLDHNSIDSGIYNFKTKREVCSGDVIEITTPDPNKYPLPSRELLLMQWMLHRVVTIRGASEEYDDDYDSDNDSDAPRVPSGIRRSIEGNDSGNLANSSDDDSSDGDDDQPPRGHQASRRRERDDGRGQPSGAAFSSSVVGALDSSLAGVSASSDPAPESDPALSDDDKADEQTTVMVGVEAADQGEVAEQGEDEATLD
jgi:HNH endonuclease